MLMKVNMLRSWTMAFIIAISCCLLCQAKKAEPVVVAYVTSWTQVVPDPTVMTHLNYAFGHVNDQFNGVRIDNEQRLRELVGLKTSCSSC